MAYTKTNWQDLPNTTTPINATNLNKMEQGIYDAHEKNIITASITSNVTISTAGQNNINLNKVISSVGSKLTLSNGKIVIGAGVNHVKISGKGQMNITTGNGDGKNFYVDKNTTEIIGSLNTIIRQYALNVSRGFGDYLISVSQGDTISYRVYAGVGDTVNNYGNYITVEVVD